MKSVTFGDKRTERLEIFMLGYERPVSGDYHDDNWVSVEVAIHCGSFQGKYSASFQIGELEAFHRQLVVLYEHLNGVAEFNTLEGQLSLEATGDGIGHIAIRGKARDQAGTGNSLLFEIHIDQTQLQDSVRSLADILASYPVRT